MSRHARANNPRNNQEAGLFVCVVVNPLGLSKEQVAQYKKLFLDAIEHYRRSLTESEENKPYARHVDDPDYSLIPELKRKVESGEDVFGGRIVRLLELVLNEYLAHLRHLKEKPWARTETIEKQLSELAQITRDGLLSIEDQLDGT